MSGDPQRAAAPHHAAAIREAARTLNRLIREARMAGISTSFGIEVTSESPSVVYVHNLRVVRPGDLLLGISEVVL